MSDKLLINLEIIPGKKRFPLNITPAKEPIVREAAQFIRDKFNLYRRNFGIKEVSDLEIMSMVALDIASAKLILESQKEIYPIIKERVGRLNEELKEYLKVRK
ncbi:MAG: cell division protein ZapA [Tannerella sp.]|jgi:hypothetical protein|nr:cell division protein ZapA [Tannerella sp.]